MGQVGGQRGPDAEPKANGGQVIVTVIGVTHHQSKLGRNQTGNRHPFLLNQLEGRLGLEVFQKDRLGSHLGSSKVYRNVWAPCRWGEGGQNILAGELQYVGEAPAIEEPCGCRVLGKLRQACASSSGVDHRDLSGLVTTTFQRHGELSIRYRITRYFL